MESWLIQITNYLLTQSWQIAVLTMAVVLVSFLLRNRSAHVRYLLWLIVLAKCLVPPLYSVPIAVLPQKESAANVPAPPVVDRMVSDYKQPETPMTKSAGTASVDSEGASLPQVTISPAGYDTRAWLAIGWILGVVALSFYYLLNALRTQIWLQKKRKALPGEFLANIESFFISNRTRHIPKVWLINGINQPFVWGLVRGSIYLPTDLLNSQDSKSWASLLGHELSHVIRFDAMVHTLQILAQVVFWFHPFVWWANRKIRAEREKCCDEMAIVSLHALPEDYSEAIVDVLAAKYESIRPVPSLAVAGPVKNIEERIKTMLRPGKKFYKRPSLIAATVVLLMAFLTVPTELVLTARAAEDATENEAESVKLLHQAAAKGDLEQVKSLISNGADVNAKAKKGWTPLHHAAVFSSEEVIKLLLAKGADVNAKNNNGWTPLDFVADRRRKNIAELFLSQSDDVSLYTAAYVGDLQKVKELIDAGTDVNAKDADGQTGLHGAAKYGHMEVIEFLVTKGARLNEKNNNGDTVLHYAARCDHVPNATTKDLIIFLLSNGAHVNEKNIHGETPVQAALQWQPKEVIDLLIEKGADVSTIHLSAYTGDLARVKSLVEMGTSASIADSDGLTPLHAAAISGQKDVAEFLISKGADINVHYRPNRRPGPLDHTPTPLYYAASSGHTNVVQLLIEKGADMAVADTYYFSPLDAAIMGGHNDVAELLVAGGAGVNILGEDDVAPLHWAALWLNSDIVKLLISHGADVDIKDNRGYTPLNYVVRSRKITARERKEMCELLLAEGADVNTKDAKGQTPLHLSARVGHRDIVELFITKGAEINAKDNQGNTPLRFANNKSHTEIVKLLRKHGAKE